MIRRSILVVLVLVGLLAAAVGTAFGPSSTGVTAETARGPLVGAGFGNPVTGSHPGDRLLSGGERERICVQVSLPASAGNRYQRTATHVTFTVVAEHAAGTS